MTLSEKAEVIKLKFCWNLNPWSGNEFRLTIFLKPLTPIAAKPLEASGEAASTL